MPEPKTRKFMAVCSRGECGSQYHDGFREIDAMAELLRCPACKKEAATQWNNGVSCAACGYRSCSRCAKDTISEITDAATQGKKFICVDCGNKWTEEPILLEKEMSDSMRQSPKKMTAEEINEIHKAELESKQRRIEQTIYSPGFQISEAKNKEEFCRTKYHKTIRGVGPDKDKEIIIDVYSVLTAFKITRPGIQHLLKKLLCAGLRKKNSELEDYREGISALERAIDDTEWEIQKGEKDGN
jgi:DNA-directed RNA polymerase subunit RPC12/RpoP